MNTPTPTAPAINPGLLSNLLAQSAPALQLTQIDKFEPPQEFTDSTGSTWTLVKNSQSGMGEVPDPQAVSITDYWNHAFPGNDKVYLYVVEGIRNPKTNREAACRVLYAWFSTVSQPAFTPAMIRPQEWLVANVYASGITDARESKLQALCRQERPQAIAPTPAADNQPAPLISMEALSHDTITSPPTRPADPGNPGERGKNNRR